MERLVNRFRRIHGNRSRNSIVQVGAITGLLPLLIGPFDILLLSVPRVHHTNPQQSITFQSRAARGCHAIRMSSSCCQIVFPLLVIILVVSGKTGSVDITLEEAQTVPVDQVRSRD